MNIDYFEYFGLLFVSYPPMHDRPYCILTYRDRTDFKVITRITRHTHWYDNSERTRKCVLQM